MHVVRNPETPVCSEEALQESGPGDDTTRAESSWGGGGLLKGSYCWVLGRNDSKRWRGDEDGQFLWIQGDPSKGKPRLLYRIIDELEVAVSKDNISFFFCQATDARINNAKEALRGLHACEPTAGAHLAPTRKLPWIWETTHFLSQVSTWTQCEIPPCNSIAVQAKQLYFSTIM